MLTINPNTHIYDFYTIKHSFIEHDDSTSSFTIAVLTLSPQIDEYLISQTLENCFAIPYMKQEQNYSEMRPKNPYRHNHRYDNKLTFSLHVDDPTIYCTEFKQALSALSHIKLSTKFVFMDYNELTNELDYITLSFTDVMILFENKLERARRQVDEYNSKPVQQILTQINSLSKEDRNILLNNLSY